MVKAFSRMSSFYRDGIIRKSLQSSWKNLPSYQSCQGTLVPKEVKCILHCISRSISSQQDTQRVQYPVMGSAVQGKHWHIIDWVYLMDCSMWCMRTGWENWVLLEKAKWRSHCCLHLFYLFNGKRFYSRSSLSGWEAMDTSWNTRHWN